MWCILFDISIFFVHRNKLRFFFILRDPNLKKNIYRKLCNFDKNKKNRFSEQRKMGRVSKYKKLDNSDTITTDKRDDGFQKVRKSRPFAMFVDLFSFNSI